MSVRNSDLSATVPGYMAIVIEVLNYAWQYRPAGVWGLAAMGRRWEARRRRSARVAPPLSPRLGGHAASAGRAWRAPGLDGTRRSENRCPLTSPAAGETESGVISPKPRMPVRTLRSYHVRLVPLGADGRHYSKGTAIRSPCRRCRRGRWGSRMRIWGTRHACSLKFFAAGGAAP